MLHTMRTATIAALAALLVAAPSAAAQAPAEPYDGHNPFACTLQQAGTGTDFPQPDADPFCVEFDKTHQNVTEGGFADFLSKEPARVAAASPKCFYFQRDHWTATVVEGQQPELYHWDGSYFFDKAKGAGGVYVENFRVGSVPMDPTVLPGFPEEYKQYFAGGKGGYQATGNVQADPNCAGKPGGSGGPPPPSQNSGCRVPGGRIGRGIGGANLGMRERRLRAALGKPKRERGRSLAWCLDGGGKLVARLGRGKRVRLVLVNAAPFDTHGIRVGRRARFAHRHLRGERRLGRVRGARVLVTRERRRSLYVGLRRGRVAFIAVAGKKLSRRGARRYLRGATGA